MSLEIVDLTLEQQLHNAYAAGHLSGQLGGLEGYERKDEFEDWLTSVCDCAHDTFCERHLRHPRLRRESDGAQ